jgi:hypothetical protein
MLAADAPPQPEILLMGFLLVSPQASGLAKHSVDELFSRFVSADTFTGL